MKRTLEERARFPLNAAAFLSQSQLECIVPKDICRSKGAEKWSSRWFEGRPFALAVHYSVYCRIIALSRSEVSQGVGILNEQTANVRPSTFYERKNGDRAAGFPKIDNFLFLTLSHWRVGNPNGISESGIDKFDLVTAW